MKIVFRTSDRDEARFVQDVLREQGIDSWIEPVRVHGGVSETELTVDVLDADEGRAVPAVRTAFEDMPEEEAAPRTPTTSSTDACPASPSAGSAGNRRLWTVLVCVVCPPLVPLAIGRALGGRVGVALAAGWMAVLSGVGGFLAAWSGEPETAKAAYALAGVFAVLGPLEIFARGRTSA